MEAVALKNEAETIMSRMDESRLRFAVQFLRFMEQQNGNVPLGGTSEAQRQERNRRELEIINANSDRLNAGAEENIEFQADLWDVE